MKNIILLIVLFITGCSQKFSFHPEDVTDMYASYVSEWQNQVKTSFDQAESVVFAPPKPDEIVGPNPDISKCICKGTGIIVQGDGHKTPCPFHHKGDAAKKQSIKIK